MFSEISNHEIWQGIERWQKMIDTAIDAKIKGQRETAEREKKRRMMATLERTASGKVSFIAPKQRYSDEEEHVKMLSSAVTGVLQQFTFYFAHYNVNIENAQKLIKKYAKRYKIDPQKLCEMELELMIPKPLPLHKKAKKELKRLSMLELAIPYISDKLTLRCLLLLNKSLQKAFKTPVFKQFLLKLSPKLPIQGRTKIWSQILNIVFKKTLKYL